MKTWAPLGQRPVVWGHSLSREGDGTETIAVSGTLPTPDFGGEGRMEKSVLKASKLFDRTAPRWL